MSRPDHRDAAHPVLLPSLLVAALMSASACDGGDSTDAPRSTPSPAAPRSTTSPAAPSSPATTGSATPPERTLRPGPPRTLDAIYRHIAGRRIKAAGRTIRVDAATVTCDGQGRPSRRPHRLGWTRFRCVQPTFPPGSVAGADLIFVVQSAAPRDLVVIGRRLTSY